MSIMQVFLGPTGTAEVWVCHVRVALVLLLAQAYDDARVDAGAGVCAAHTGCCCSRRRSHRLAAWRRAGCCRCDSRHPRGSADARALQRPCAAHVCYVAAGSRPASWTSRATGALLEVPCELHRSALPRRCVLRRCHAMMSAGTAPLRGHAAALPPMPPTVWQLLVVDLTSACLQLPTAGWR